jgi:hypothetical protein
VLCVSGGNAPRKGRKRLEALIELNMVGAGFALAEKDMDLRGALSAEWRSSSRSKLSLSRCYAMKNTHAAAACARAGVRRAPPLSAGWVRAVARS